MLIATHPDYSGHLIRLLSAVMSKPSRDGKSEPVFMKPTHLYFLSHWPDSCFPSNCLALLDSDSDSVPDSGCDLSDSGWHSDLIVEK